MIHNILYVCLIGLTHIVCLWFLVEKKYSLKISLIGYSICFLIFAGICSLCYYYLKDNRIAFNFVSYLSTIITCGILFFFLSKYSFIESFFLLINYSNLFNIFTISGILVFQNAFPFLEAYILNYIRALNLIVLSGISLFLYVKYVRHYIFDIACDKKEWIGITIVSFLFLLLFVPLVNIARFYLDNIHFFNSFVALTITYGGVLFIIFKIIKGINLNQNVQMINQNLSYLNNQLAVYKRNAIYGKRIRHDFHHHCQNVISLLQNQQIDDAINYLKEYSQSLDNSKIKEFTTHNTLNAIISNFYTKCTDLNIPFEANVKCGDELKIDNLDLVAIIANALENAFNESKKVEHPHIKVDINLIDNKLIFVEENATKNDIEIVNGMIKYKGIGIDSMISSIKKNQGEIKFEYKDHLIQVCIILNNK